VNKKACLQERQLEKERGKKGRGGVKESERERD
jgi:hypothetical protein